jgi:hypothetical protein
MVFQYLPPQLTYLKQTRSTQIMTELQFDCHLAAES